MVFSYVVKTDFHTVIHETNDSFEPILLMNRSFSNTHTSVCVVFDTCFTQQIFPHSHPDSSWWCNVCFICWSGCSLTCLSAGELMSWRPFDLRTPIFLTPTPSVLSISMFYSSPVSQLSSNYSPWITSCTLNWDKIFQRIIILYFYAMCTFLCLLIF